MLVLAAEILQEQQQVMHQILLIMLKLVLVDQVHLNLIPQVDYQESLAQQ